MSISKETSFLTTAGICFGATILCFIIGFIAIILGIIFSILFAYTNDNYIYTEKGYCEVISYTINNGTCSYECNCNWCGKTTCCSTCYYFCYKGSWNILLNDIDNFANYSTNYTTNSTDSWPVVSSIFSNANSDGNSVLQDLKTKPIGYISECFYDPNDYQKVNWGKSDDPYTFMVIMIVSWSVLGCSALFFFIGSGITTVSFILSQIDLD